MLISQFENVYFKYHRIFTYFEFAYQLHKLLSPEIDYEDGSDIHYNNKERQTWTKAMNAAVM